jgi:predicted nicotinamide N-methyase
VPRPFVMDPAAFILRYLPLIPGPDAPDIMLHLAAPQSGLSRLTRQTTPYWAYVWAGGAVLALYVRDHPGAVQGKRVLDLGAGSGLVAIAAARAGAIEMASEIDQLGAVAIRLNAAANGVEIVVSSIDPLDEEIPKVDLILVGDLFYDPVLVAPVLAFLTRAAAQGIDILIGDPGPTTLPSARLTALESYNVGDFGPAQPAPATIYRLGS